MKIIRARNVNDALQHGINLFHETNQEHWSTLSPRGNRTIEYNEPVCTVYERPCERVLFYSARKANPVFHLMEALWILDGRRDVSFLTRYNPRMADYSDNGMTFHAAYGYRLREEFGIDQLETAIDVLKKDPDTRRCVLGIWDPTQDLGHDGRDLPCNDTVALKLRDGRLNMSVFNRSNDMVWGAYGANAVQFSMLQEFIARAIGAQVGTYRQFSDSFHVYTSGPGGATWRRLERNQHRFSHYDGYRIQPYPIMSIRHDRWQAELRALLTAIENDETQAPLFSEPFFQYVVWPIHMAYLFHRKQSAVTRDSWMKLCKAQDWRAACNHYFSEQQKLW